MRTRFVVAVALGFLSAAAASEADAVKSLEAAGVKFARDKKKQVVLPQTLFVGGDKFRDEHVKLLGEIKTLEHLVIDPSAKVTGDGLKFLGGIPKLNGVAVDGRFIDPAAAKTLASLTNLKYLSVRNSVLTDADIKVFAALTKLAHLDLRMNEKLTGSTLGELVGLKNLETLILNANVIGDLPGFDALKDLPKLTMLDFNAATLGDGGLKQLKGFKALRTLQLQGTQVTDAGLAAIAGLTDLEILRLSDTKITGESVKTLAGFKKLKILSLPGGWPRERYDELAKALPKCELR